VSGFGGFPKRPRPACGAFRFSGPAGVRHPTFPGCGLFPFDEYGNPRSSNPGAFDGVKTCIEATASLPLRQPTSGNANSLRFPFERQNSILGSSSWEPMMRLVGDLAVLGQAAQAIPPIPM
jgi:hypothetical protein